MLSVYLAVVYHFPTKMHVPAETACVTYQTQNRRHVRDFKVLKKKNEIHILNKEIKVKLTHCDPTPARLAKAPRLIPAPALVPPLPPPLFES